MIGVKEFLVSYKRGAVEIPVIPPSETLTVALTHTSEGDLVGICRDGTLRIFSEGSGFPNF